MEENRSLKYLKKLLPFILIFCILATAMVGYALSRANTYVASVVIHYTAPSAEQGVTPNGSRLDVNEIKSAAVLSRVISQLSLGGTYSVDNLVSRISITPLPDADKEAQKNALLEEGEEYIYEPTTYIVSFAASNSEGANFARKLLDTTLDIYYELYSRQYINVTTVNNNLNKLYEDNYDYIEIVELIDSNIENTLSALYKRIEATPYFRANSTETSFDDLAAEFNFIHQVTVNDLYARIFQYQITKDKSMLVSDYNTRIDNNIISNAGEEEMIKAILQVMDSYVDKMRESDNTNITFEYILDDVYEKHLTDGNGNFIAGGDQTVTYDELIFAWRDHNVGKAHAVIDSAYCQYVISAFENCAGFCKDEECLKSGKTCSELGSKNYSTLESELDADIRATIDQLTALYEVTTATNDEYNQYLGAQHIAVLSSASVKPSINVTLYTAIAFAFLIIVCCGSVLLLARLNDIVNFAFYTDPITKLHNRAFFDKYLKTMDGKILDDGTVFVLLDLTNMIQINTDFSRKTGDEVLKLLSDHLTAAFRTANATFIYNGNSRFFVLLENTDYIVVEDTMTLFRARLDMRDTLQEVPMHFSIGIAETFKSKIHSARKLVSETITNRKHYISEIKK